MNVLIVGNVLKDVYLRLDERHNDFEVDERGLSWLDLGFDGATHPFFRRTSVYGGAAVTLEVFRRFGIAAQISGSRLDYRSDGLTEGAGTSEYRYILCRGNQVCYLTPSERTRTVFEAPAEAVDWIFVDRSATVTRKLITELKTFLSVARTTRVAVYWGAEMGEAAGDLLEMADFVFTEDANLKSKAPICLIEDGNLRLNRVDQTWSLPRTDLMTHLTAHSVIAAAVLGALLKGRTVRDSLLAGKVDAENASLDGSLDWDRVAELIEKERAVQEELRLTARALVADGKGILAADESGGSIHKKFEEAGIVDDYENRRQYRQIFVTTPDLEKYVNGVILFDETARQKLDNGQGFVEALTARGIIPGVKVDQGLEPLLGTDEVYTKGLEGLRERLREYYQMGLRFAKWRAALMIGEGTPSERAIAENCRILAEYARDCQAERIVPIVEPEVVHDGDYSIERCAEVTSAVLRELFDQLRVFQVDTRACILKCNMVLAGKGFATQSTPEEVGAATAKVLLASVPKELAGVVFLSGGQTPEQATENLLAVQRSGGFPWPVTFSFARALQGPALDAWQGKSENVEAAQRAFLTRLKANCEKVT